MRFCARRARRRRSIAGLRFITELGQHTDARRNETIIAADTLGISTLATLLNNTIGAHRTDPALLGPFWRKDAPRRQNGESIAYSLTPGPAVFVSGRVMDTSGTPIPGAAVDVWHASPVGFYENQDPEQADYNLRGVFTADAEGRYAFRTVKPAGYPVPVDGPVGGLLKATNRHPYRPAHFHYMVTHPGYKTLITQVFSDDDEHLDSDVTFSVVRSLVGKFHRHDGGRKPAEDVTAPWYTLRYRPVSGARRDAHPRAADPLMTAIAKTARSQTGHFDVLIVGAGISGIGGAYHLTQQCPGTSFVVLETQDSFGGTWLTHRYPGIRSDSDLFTFGYRFKPWTGPPIATAAEILSYMGEVIEENDLARHIRYRHTDHLGAWSSDEKRWTIEATRTDTGEAVRFTANFLWMCQGYYRHSEGYTPEWEGMDRFRGRIVHPQTWPEDLDYAGKNVVVIGSGATAATLIPAIAADCRHVTMLQRSPTFFRTGRNAIEIADELRELDINEAWIHEIVRKKILHEQSVFTRRSFSEPEAVKQELLAAVRAYLGPDYDLETHFTPRYRPWRQRIAFIPDGDLFQGIRPARHRSSPMRSSDSPKPVSC